ncbi:GNAT family N-acetyltransferase [Sorangium atrum]|uniref:GNAT family N-acetyltransferase n=1 Tax=Sorangium atrum TaxID=2995308 RepID=A0ABT5BTZ1_9BACT|nr:GNAT family N-acetyltransferase [Sorangium aterium]MDC0677626.1 GNAT family N-acetyltransferase [Sorangium aterium]
MPSLDTDDDALLLTERLSLRPHRLADVRFMMELNSDPEVVRYTGDTAFACEDEARAVVARLARQFEDFRMGRLIVSDRTTGEKLGWCGLRWHDDLEVADLGYRFFRKHWGRGYATESAAACIRYAVEELRLPRLVAHAMLENAASVKVLEKLGFCRTGPTVFKGLVAEGFELLLRA